MGERQFVCLWKTVSIVFHAFQLIDCDHIAHIQVRQIPLLPIMIWRLLCTLILWFEFIGEILVWYNNIYKRIKCCGKHTMNSMIFRWKITFHNAVLECSSNSIIVEFIQRMTVCARRRRKIVSCCLFLCVLSKLCLCHNCALYRPYNKYSQTKLIEFAFCQQLSQLVGAKAVYRTSILERKRQTRSNEHM